ncbi:MAG: hypothetical protein ABSF15_08710 [Candidatus Sulfotelmatobacter sp.]|jgi:hypothetical protein
MNLTSRKSMRQEFARPILLTPVARMLNTLGKIGDASPVSGGRHLSAGLYTTTASSGTGRRGALSPRNAPVAIGRITTCERLRRKRYAQ